MKRFVVEYENEVFWIYDSSEKNLLFYTDIAKDLSKWLEKNIQDK